MCNDCASAFDGDEFVGCIDLAAFSYGGIRVCVVPRGER
jgi:hypothetical protein